MCEGLPYDPEAVQCLTPVQLGTMRILHEQRAWMTVDAVLRAQGRAVSEYTVARVQHLTRINAVQTVQSGVRGARRPVAITAPGAHLMQLLGKYTPDPHSQRLLIGAAIEDDWSSATALCGVSGASRSDHTPKALSTLAERGALIVDARVPLRKRYLVTDYGRAVARALTPFLEHA